MNIPFYNNIDLNNNIIINVGTPTNPNDVVNKNYVDTSIEALTKDLNTQITTLNDNITSYINTSITNLTTNIETQLNDTKNNYIPNILIQNIVDNLNTSDSTKSLSANQGNILYTMINNVPINSYTNTINKVGNWDEYDLYRMKIEKTITNPTQFYTISFPEISLETYEIINITGFYTIDNNKKWLSSNSIVNNSSDTDINIKYGVYIYNYDISSNTVYLYIGSDTVNTLNNQIVTFIIEFIDKTIE